ncbi:glycosyltransferase family 39 protein [Desulfosediminicola sp.]|uniref:glycosyltransferase family 39 protein n=1 Tax=Desulfosediminicola sp. TaxID=2886825 RepID=UPI003AF23985
MDISTQKPEARGFMIRSLQILENKLDLTSDLSRFLILFSFFLLSFLLKFSLIKVGSPFVTIDDITTFEGGFLVWFGQSPPQHMYLESWICGLCSLSTYVFKMVSSGNVDAISFNLVADAYRDFYGRPDEYVHNYRILVILIDMATGYLVYCVGKQVLGNCWQGWAAVLVCLSYLLSYNTFWCDIVARPDSFVVFFSTLGLYFYYKSVFGKRLGWFLAAAVAFGLAAGMKLHGAFFTIFIALDLFRFHGLRKGFGNIVIFVCVSIFFFCFAAGSLFADPLTYIKLRMANVKDDVSPWINWGEQFISIFNGTGWLIVPGVLGAFVFAMFNWNSIDGPNEKMKSIILQSMCWLTLFASIRQLRAYWMLPALPLFYSAAVYGLSRVPRRSITATLAIFSVVILTIQSYAQARDFKRVDFGQLRSWIQDNAFEKPFYIIGFESVILPKNTICIRNRTTGIRRSMSNSLAAGLPFTLRYLKYWEERSQLVLFDMLDQRYDSGYEYYSFYRTPLDAYSDIIDIEDMHYILLQEHFPISGQLELSGYIQKHFTEIAELTGAGGGGTGLKYKVLERIPL